MQGFIETWQHIPEHIRPYLFKIGEFQIRFYGLMYIIGFGTVYLLCRYRIKRDRFNYSLDLIDSYFMWAIIGLLIGARLGYVIFYNLDYYLAHPLEIALPFSIDGGIHFTGLAGMSYHGGLIGVILASIVFCRKREVDFWRFGDFLIPSIPLGYTFGRIGNFINGELYGRVTDLPWGMYFPLDPSHKLRHPSQLYEAFFEGIVLFLILWKIRNRRLPKGAFLGLYIIGYGVFRFFIEFVREPDAQLGFIIYSLTMGQILCLLMIIVGILILTYTLRKGYNTKS